nr:hypothetical protein [Tanacetum cinerariifolium]
ASALLFSVSGNSFGGMTQSGLVFLMLLLLVTASTSCYDVEVDICLDELQRASLVSEVYQAKLRTSELEAVLKPMDQNHAFSSCFGQSPLEEVEEDLGYNGVSYET